MLAVIVTTITIVTIICTAGKQSSLVEQRPNLSHQDSYSPLPKFKTSVIHSPAATRIKRGPAPVRKNSTTPPQVDNMTLSLRSLKRLWSFARIVVFLEKTKYLELEGITEHHL